MDAGERLYNGIVLPSTWPPRAEKLTNEPMKPPYLAAPPAVIPIDVGRQLFVDDFLVEKTDLKRTFHLAELHPANPILKPDTAWETATQRDPTAMVFSDGVWLDPQDKLFKMWYMGGYVRGTCYATSKDGIAWEKPKLDFKEGTNVVQEGWRDSSTTWLDLEEKDPAKRWKIFVVQSHEKKWKLSVHFSPDGIHWGERVAWSTPVGDRTTVFYNPFRKVWVYGIRSGMLTRSRFYREHPDALAGATWKPEEAVPWVGADTKDPPRDDLKIQPQLYNLDAVAYESLMLGLFTIWPGQPKDRAKPNYVCLGFSRDGFHWSRPDHRPFIGVSEKYGDWNWGNVQSAGGGCLVVGDRLYFYFSARAGIKGSTASGVCTTGLATLRRDGFASMDAEGGGVLTTRLVTFRGKHLYVNVAAPEGGLLVTVLDANGNVLPGFSCQQGVPVRGDTTCARVAWKNGDDLSAHAGKPVRFRFYLSKARLYSFWVSPDASGASHGYVAAGGPGFTGPTDTVGAAAR
ncbi:MAG: glycosyl hydrolase family 32 [Planctomycetes bacterium]|nr:glycosyl hydrolase family 32 [Planctomycetota bacterium]